MKKTFKFMGIALLAAGVSFAVSSCDKESATALEEEEVVVEQTVDFEDLLTKADGDNAGVTLQVKESTDSVSIAIKKLIAEIAEFNDEVESALFDVFTSVFSGDYTKKISIGEIFKASVNVWVNHKEKEGYPVNAVAVTFDGGKLNLTTKDGYYLTILVPGWTSWIEDNEKLIRLEKGVDVENSEAIIKPTSLVSGFKFLPELQYIVEIGKGTRPFASSQFTFSSKKSERTVVGVSEGAKIAELEVSVGKEEEQKKEKVDLYTGEAEILLYNAYTEVVAGAYYNFNPLTLITKVSSIEVWYDNTNLKEGLGTTSIAAQNLGEIFWSLSQITDSYSYREQEAREIVDAFNSNVTRNLYGDITYGDSTQLLIDSENMVKVDDRHSALALVNGNYLWARKIKDEKKSELFRVVVSYGEVEGKETPKTVTTGSLVRFLNEHFRSVIELWEKTEQKEGDQ